MKLTTFWVIPLDR